ncbi:MAG: SusC/RagA family TonB-linked outer membrane protein [Saprospiraceae bacterium]|nr:SusC/RagA family TonB-linked outer membrane protein [Saprospiraceae bacterium]
MKKIYLVFLLFIAILGVSEAQRMVKGTVTDNSGTPVIGANVVVKGTAIGTVTNSDGQYSLNVPADAKSIVVSYAGYESKELDLGVSDILDFSIVEGKILDEVLVVGYGTQRKSSLTGSISQVKGEDIALMPIQSFDQALQGRSAGVNITTPNGVLNNPPVIRIRGANSINLSSQPLIVIDGIPTYSGNLRSGNNSSAYNPLTNINPGDIESIEVLKDASASAIYGSRAANGVILVTTKKGKQGKSAVNYDAWVGWSQPVRLFDILDADEYLLVKNEASVNAGGAADFFKPSLDINGEQVNTNWYDYVMQTGLSHNHNLNFSGANEKSNYYLSVGHTAQEGMIKGNEFSRTSAKLNFDHQLFNFLKIGTNLNYAFSSNQAPNTGSLDGQSFATAGLGRLPLITAPIVSPYIRTADGRGAYDPGAGIGYNIVLGGANMIGPMANGSNRIGFYNPAFLLDNNRHNSDGNHFIGNIFGELTLLKGLKLRSSFGSDVLSIENHTFWDARHGDGQPQNGFAENTFDKLRRWNLQNLLTYDFNVNNSVKIGLLAGTEEQYTSRDRWGAQRIGISDQFFTTFQGNYTTINPAFNFQTENYLSSVLSRVNVGVMDRLYATFNYRRDGFSAFATGKKFGDFYGGSLGYVLSEDNYWKNGIGDLINFFKIRASYGLVGNNGVADYASLSLFNSTLYHENPTLQFSQVGNPDLTWESSKKLDIGFSAGLWQDKLQVEFAYYQNLIDGLILSVPQSPSKGIPGNTINTNVGSMTNSGIELSVSFTPIRKQNFEWRIGGNFSTLTNVVDALANNNADIVGITATLEQTNITRLGESVGSLYVVQTDGVNPENGRRVFLLRVREGDNFVYKRVQYDHSAAAADRWTFVDGSGRATAPTIANSGVVMGPTLPTYFGGLDNNFRIFNFDLGIMFQFQGGNYIYNGTKAGLRDMRFWNNHTDVLDRWTPENKNGTIPRLILNDNVSNGSALPISENVEKGDFVRLRNLSLGYTLPSNLTSKIRIASLRMYVQAQNALLFTSYSGSDPEISTNGSSNVAPGVDRNSVGQARAYTIGLQVGF